MDSYLTLGSSEIDMNGEWLTSLGSVVDHSSFVPGGTNFVDSDLTVSKLIISATHQSTLDRIL